MFFKKKKDDIFEASEKGDLNRIAALLEQGIDVNITNSFCTPLTYAVKANQLAAVKLLIAYGADIDSYSSYYGRPFECCNSMEMIELFLSHGIKPEEYHISPDKSSLLNRIICSRKQKKDFFYFFDSDLLFPKVMEIKEKILESVFCGHSFLREILLVLDKNVGCSSDYVRINLGKRLTSLYNDGLFCIAKGDTLLTNNSCKELIQLCDELINKRKNIKEK